MERSIPMKIKIMMTALVLILAMPAAAQFTTVQLAHEVVLSELRLPSHVSGTIAFKGCSDCAYQTKRVSERTRYMVNGRSVPLDKFRGAVSHIRNRSEQYVTVLHHLEDDVVTQVSISLL
jgi:hypothetical protein